jgi:hypothetical protein
VEETEKMNFWIFEIKKFLKITTFKAVSNLNFILIFE